MELEKSTDQAGRGGAALADLYSDAAPGRDDAQLQSQWAAWRMTLALPGDGLRELGLHPDRRAAVGAHDTATLAACGALEGSTLGALARYSDSDVAAAGKQSGSQLDDLFPVPEADGVRQPTRCGKCATCVAKVRPSHPCVLCALKSLTCSAKQAQPPANDILYPKTPSPSPLAPPG